MSSSQELMLSVCHHRQRPLTQFPNHFGGQKKPNRKGIHYLNTLDIFIAL